jgi:polysaccharide biosynthesis transport protein
METNTPSILRELVFIIFDRLKLIVFIFAFIFLLFFLYAITTPDSYRASSTFTMSIPRTLDPLQQDTFGDYQQRARRTLLAQQELIFSNRVLEHVVYQFYPDTTSENYTNVLNRIRQRLEVTPPEGQTFAESSTFYITYTDLKPERTAEIASFITNMYLMEYENLAKEKTDYSYSFFQEQTNELYKEMTEKAEILRDYEALQALALVEILALDPDKAAAAEVGPNVLLNQFQTKYYELTEELSALNIAISTLEKEMQEHRVPALPEDMEVFGRAVVTYRNKVAQLDILMNEMKTQFTENFTPFQQTKKEYELSVAALREEMSRSIRAQRMNAETIAKRIQEVEKVILELQERIKTTAYERSEYERIKQDYMIAREAYLSTRNQTEQARLASAVSQAQQYLSLVQKPIVPTRPASPNRPLIITLGFVAAILLSLGLAITVDFFDHTLKKPQDVETYFKVPNLGSLPSV